MKDILVKVGDFGLYQKLLCCIFVFYTTFLCGLNYYTQVPFNISIESNILAIFAKVFIFVTPDHRCSEETLDKFHSSSNIEWDEMLPWIPRIKGYPR